MSEKWGASKISDQYRLPGVEIYSGSSSCPSLVAMVTTLRLSLWTQIWYCGADPEIEKYLERERER
ncbi:hypothetical protein LSH36_1177g00030 [Paralvinella palmiformis]|uniref:Uncharacterized protein n=1 Tax=Paralvinella palmiformis TaxID=53620 RepID=A0AAD9IUY1_9ANNE|nr:hypothetical protein LSH36_1177g00030 [Paralvinella palmiformis]